MRFTTTAGLFAALLVGGIPGSAGAQVRVNVAFRIPDRVAARVEYYHPVYVAPVRYDRHHHRQARRYRRIERDLARHHRRWHRRIAREHARLHRDLDYLPPRRARALHRAWHERIAYEHRDAHDELEFEHEERHEREHHREGHRSHHH